MSSSAIPERAAQQQMPVFIDEPARTLNMDLSEPRQEGVFNRNYDALIQIAKLNPEAVRSEMKARLNDQSSPMSLRFITAAVLVLEGDEGGKLFFKTQARRIDDNIDALYITLAQLEISAPYLKPERRLDMSWAEDLMIEALQNRTKLNRAKVYGTPDNVRYQDSDVEVRELAVVNGQFPMILAKLESKKGLPVLIGLIREKPSKYYAKELVGYLGEFKDRTVEPLLIDILKEHEDSEHGDTYRLAIGAAIELGMKSAVPILLRHLDDQASYAGLRALAQPNIKPIIDRNLPRLRSEARAEAQLLLIHLQGSDLIPPLVALLRKEGFPKRDEIMDELVDLRDPRSVPILTSLLCGDKDWYVRSMAIRALSAIRTPEAILGLIEDLTCDFSILKEGKVSADHDYNAEYREKIANALREITGQDFGKDAQKWKTWLTKARSK